MSARFLPILCILYVASEAGLLWLKRSGQTAADADRGSLSLLWIVISVSMAAAFTLANVFPQLSLGPAGIWQAVGAAVFAAGILLRWYAILSLGRFFTVNVAIASDHQLVEAGPYRPGAPPLVHGCAYSRFSGWDSASTTGRRLPR